MGGPDPSQLERLGESLRALHVAVGHARLYGAAHQQTRKAMREALEGLQPLLDSFGSIDLASSPDGLLWQGEMAHHETDDMPGLGRLLHREGIALLSLGRGLQDDELGRLLEVLRVNFELPEYEEQTLESLLWQSAFERIGFQAVAALMEAEALSGRIASPARDMDIEGQSRGVRDLRVGGTRRAGERRNLARVSEEAIARAVAGSDLAGLGPAEDARRTEEESRQWRVRFAQDGSEDAEEIAAARLAVEKEDSADLLARLVGVLMRAAMAQREELTPEDALVLARQAVEEIYRRGDPVGLVRVLDEGTALMEEPFVKGSPLAGLVREFFANAVSPRRIARVLLSLDPERGGDEDLERLVLRLPDSVLQSVLEAAAHDKDEKRAARLRSLLGAVVGDRVDAWLLAAADQPPERVVPTIGLARSLGRIPAAGVRARLLGHASRLVREEILHWYVSDLPASEMPKVLPLIVDPQPTVRRAAATALAAHRPYEAAKWLRRLVEAQGFSDRDPEIKRDACIALGLVAGDGAVEPLVKLLSQKAGVLGADPRVLSDLEAAARGLAAAGTVSARQALKQAGGGLFGARKRLCAEAIERLEQGRPW